MSSGNALTDTFSAVAATDPLSGIAKVATDPVTSIVKAAGGTVASAGLHAIGSWVLDGTRAALQEVAGVIGTATAPNLESTWFSSTYWRVAALAALLTVPFLCAAAVQAVARADLALLAKSAFGYLPLALLAVSLAAPLTMLLLSATDQMSATVSAGAVDNGANFLDQTAAAVGAASVLDGSPFLAVVVGLFTIMAALALATELLIREAAVYVVVLMLPLAFAALVWPARRIWAVRIVELLASLILSKFVIVAVLTLAAAPFANGSGTTISQVLMAMSLVMLATFSPWALMRILPFTELAAGAAGMLRRESHGAALDVGSQAAGGSAWVMDIAERMRTQSGQALAGSGPGVDTGSSFGNGSGPASGFGSDAAADSGSASGSTADADSAPTNEAGSDPAFGSDPGTGSVSKTPASATPAGSPVSEPEARPVTTPSPNPTPQPPTTPTPGQAPQTSDGEGTAYVPPEFMRGSEPLTLGPEFVNGQPPAGEHPGGDAEAGDPE